MNNPLLKLITRFITPYTLYWGAAVGAAINAYSSNRASSAARKAGDADRAQQRLSLEEQKRQYDIGQENLRPYREAGGRGLETYEGMLEQDNLAKWGGFSLDQMQEDPGYQFRLQQGYQGLDRMAARGGNRFSGSRAIGLMQYGQQMGAQEFGAARDRSFQDYQTRRGEGMFRLGQYANLAQMGQQASGAASNLGSAYANAVTGINQSIGSSFQASGNARAAGYLGMGNAVTSGLAAYNYNRGNTAGYNGGFGSDASYGAGYDDGNDYDAADAW